MGRRYQDLRNHKRRIFKKYDDVQLEKYSQLILTSIFEGCVVAFYDQIKFSSCDFQECSWLYAHEKEDFKRIKKLTREIRMEANVIDSQNGFESILITNHSTKMDETSFGFAQFLKAYCPTKRKVQLVGDNASWNNRSNYFSKLRESVAFTYTAVGHARGNPIEQMFSKISNYFKTNLPSNCSEEMMKKLIINSFKDFDISTIKNYYRNLIQYQLTCIN